MKTNTKVWHKLNERYFACYFANGRTDVKNIETGEIVMSRSPSLQDDLKRGNIAGPLCYLFGFVI